MAEIMVDPNELKNKAQTLKNIASTIQTTLDSANSEIDSMKAYWEGEAAQSSVNTFKELKQKLQTSYENIEKYAKFLDEAAEDYQNVEMMNIQE